MNLKFRGKVGYWLLRIISKRPGAETAPQETIDDLDSGCWGFAKLERFLGRGVWKDLEDRRVLDFGCGSGAEAVAAAQRGAEFVYGLDIQSQRLEIARRRAHRFLVGDRCIFLNPLTDGDEITALVGTIDCAYSIDSFEHYDDPATILAIIERLLAPGGQLLISFGPPWKNPYGCHMWFFNRFPWIHLLFEEETILAVRRRYRDDGARRFCDVDGGLNQMTIERFEQLVQQSGMKLESLRAVPLSSRFVNGPIWWQKLFTLKFLREYTTSVVLCRLTKSPSVVSIADLEAAMCQAS